MPRCGDVKRLKFDYLKSNFFRVVHADGVWGGVTPRLDIQMAFWNERQPIATQVVHEVVEGHLGPEIREERIVREAIVREVEVSVLMDLEGAKNLVEWLKGKIAEAEKVLEAAKQESTKSDSESKGRRRRDKE